MFASFGSADVRTIHKGAIKLLSPTENEGGKMKTDPPHSNSGWARMPVEGALAPSPTMAMLADSGTNTSFDVAYRADAKTFFDGFACMATIGFSIDEAKLDNAYNTLLLPSAVWNVSL
jgi:hypothetical protein